MRYMMKSGTLSNPKNGRMLAQIKSSFWGARKTIFLSDDDKQYHTDINILGAPAKKSGNVRLRIFTLNNNNGEVLMEAHPCYAKDDDPDIVGWPICRTPKIDHADLSIGDIWYLLVMHNNQNYSLKDKIGTIILQIMHKGISGGWTIDTTEKFPAQVLCGLFIFCRYIEQENEFIVV